MTGHDLLTWRTAAGLSQHQAAELLGTVPRYLRRLERSDRPLSPPMIARLEAVQQERGEVPKETPDLDLDPAPGPVPEVPAEAPSPYRLPVEPPAPVPDPEPEDDPLHEPGSDPGEDEPRMTVGDLRRVLARWRLPLPVAALVLGRTAAAVATWTRRDTFPGLVVPDSAPLPPSLSVRVRLLLHAPPYRGEDLAAWRDRWDFTLADAAALLGIAADRLRDLEAASTRHLPPDVAHALACMDRLP